MCWHRFIFAIYFFPCCLLGPSEILVLCEPGFRYTHTVKNWDEIEKYRSVPLTPPPPRHCWSSSSFYSSLPPSRFQLIPTSQINLMVSRDGMWVVMNERRRGPLKAECFWSTRFKCKGIKSRKLALKEHLFCLTFFVVFHLRYVETLKAPFTPSNSDQTFWSLFCILPPLIVTVVMDLKFHLKCRTANKYSFFFLLNVGCYSFIHDG